MKKETDMQNQHHQPQRVNDAEQQRDERGNVEEPLGIIEDERKFFREETC